MGFLISKPDPAKVFIEVPATLADRVRRIFHSLTLHEKHNVLNAFPAHFARNATRTAEKLGLLSEVDADAALASHRSANRGKHSWSPIASSASAASGSSAVAAEDPLVSLDP